MRALLVSIVCAAQALASSPALADGCPKQVDEGFARGLGPERAWLSDHDRVYQPAGLRMLGVPVSYVVVHRKETFDRQDRINRVMYRLQGVARASGQQYPVAVRQAFDRLYGAHCATQSNNDSLHCFADLPLLDGVGQLAKATVDRDDFYIDDSASGAALALARADADMPDASPGYLVCTYNID